MSQLQFQCPPQGGSHAPAMPSTAAASASSPQSPMPMGGQQQQHAPQPGYSIPCATGGGGGGTPQPGYSISCATGGGGGGTPQSPMPMGGQQQQPGGYSIGCATGGGGGGPPQPGYSIGCATGGAGTPQPGYSNSCATGGGGGGGGPPQPGYSNSCATGGGGGGPPQPGYSNSCATGGGGGGGGPPQPGYSISCATVGGGGGGGPPQPGYSIPCATGGTLPSESASHPLRSSALPSGSATPFTLPPPTTTTTTVSNMANPKEKTPMCLVNELARFNKIQPEYKLLSEEGPAHSKIFSVRLTLGEQHWEADGTSIKKAQHTAASSALAETTLPKPTARSPRNTDCMTHTMELNALCMKLGKKPVYKPVDPYLGMRPPNFNYNVRSPGPYQRSMQQYYYPFPPVGPMLYHIELSIGGQQFHGKGRTRQLAKHDAAARALKLLQKEPIVEQLPAMNGDPEEEEENLNKSEISQVFEISLKRNLPVNFEVLKEAGPPHMKSFVVRVAVGEFSGEGEGKSKKIAKKLAATAVLEELRKLPHIPTVEKMLPRMKKKTKSIIKLQTSPEYGQGMNPISRLAQIQQAKKEKEPEYCMVTERGLPRRREFVMQVTVCSQCAEGMGPSKKVAKRNAAEKMLELLGYKVPQPQPPKPALRTDEKVPIKKPGDGRKVTFYEEEATMGAKEEDYRLPYLNHQQLPAGILPMVPEVAQAVGAQCHGQLHGKDYKRPAPNPAVATLTAMIANELLYAGTSPTAETVLKNGSQPSPALPHGPLTRPSEQLGFLASVQGLQVEYKDFPKNNKNEFVSLINCSSQPPLISHGIGKDVDSCHDMAALNILKLLSELDQQQHNDRTGNGPISGCGKQQEMDTESLLKQANSSTLAQTLDGTV